MYDNENMVVETLILGVVSLCLMIVNVLSIITSAFIILKVIPESHRADVDKAEFIVSCHSETFEWRHTLPSLFNDPCFFTFIC